MDARHYVTIHATLGSLLLMNPLSFKLQVLLSISPNIEIQDIKQPCRLTYFKEKPKKGHYFLLEQFYVTLLLLLLF